MDLKRNKSKKAIPKNRKKEKLHVSWLEVETIIWELADLIKESKKKKFDYVYGIPRGGLVPAVMLSHALQVPLVIDTVKATLATSIIFIDDVNDTGKTFTSQGSVVVRDINVALFEKPWSTFKIDFHGRKTDKWVVFPWELNDKA